MISKSNAKKVKKSTPAVWGRGRRGNSLFYLPDSILKPAPVPSSSSLKHHR